MECCVSSPNHPTLVHQFEARPPLWIVSFVSHISLPEGVKQVAAKIECAAAGAFVETIGHDGIAFAVALRFEARPQPLGDVFGRARQAMTLLKFHRLRCRHHDEWNMETPTSQS